MAETMRIKVLVEKIMALLLLLSYLEATSSKQEVLSN